MERLHCDSDIVTKSAESSLFLSPAAVTDAQTEAVFKRFDTSKATTTKKNKATAKDKFPHLPFVLDLMPFAECRSERMALSETSTGNTISHRGGTRVKDSYGKSWKRFLSVSFKSLLSFPLHLPSFVIDLEVKREKHPTFTTNTLILS